VFHSFSMATWLFAEGSVQTGAVSRITVAKGLRAAGIVVVVWTLD